MKYTYIIFFASLISCGGSLSEEQRKKMRDQMEAHEIRKVSEVEITEAAYAEGRNIVQELTDLKGDSTRIDSVVRSRNGNIRWLTPKSAQILPIEQQMMDAYLADETGVQQDNIQKVRNSEGETDSLLYTKPVIEYQSDGKTKLAGVWNIWLSKKQLILAMDKK